MGTGVCKNLQKETDIETENTIYSKRILEKSEDNFEEGIKTNYKPKSIILSSFPKTTEVEVVPESYDSIPMNNKINKIVPELVPIKAIPNNNTPLISTTGRSTERNTEKNNTFLSTIESSPIINQPIVYQTEEKDTQYLPQIEPEDKPKDYSFTLSLHSLPKSNKNKIWNKADISSFLPGDKSSSIESLFALEEDDIIYECPIYELLNSKLILKYFVLFKRKIRIYRSKEAFLYHWNFLNEINISGIIQCDLISALSSKENISKVNSNSKNGFFVEYANSDIMEDTFNITAFNNTSSTAGFPRKKSLNSKGKISLISEENISFYGDAYADRKFKTCGNFIKRIPPIPTNKTQISKFFITKPNTPNSPSNDLNYKLIKLINTLMTGNLNGNNL